ncbi:glycoside hydrolase family 9 protein [Simiduia curdlanivorans]|uniref:Endoglucanase n=1 Tax=Simiduia curdlanivorans TaxID=1492769 RepID=A0ABV8V385_9GAMM|nr:glycoside hydrolase family 9 protein [Simiduia curdlanivorans]MDN3638323.1 glycoside hydrolase family 9 protein [Simiduia curdlanivorans]
MKKTFIKTALFSAVAFCSANTLAAPNYGEALQKSIYFYEAQQAGKLPAWNRVEWRGDSVLDDGSDVGKDLSGGWFDAGDHVKFGFPMAASATMLAWGVIEYPQAYTQSGQMAHIKNNLRFVADYFVSAHTAPNELYGQVGSGSADHAWWGSPEVVHLTSRAASNRPAFKVDASCPGSDLAGETAAALSAIAMVFKTDDPAYSANLINHAKQLYSFANTYKGKYSACITDASGFYNSWSGYNDELVWSAIWLHRATGEQSYLDAAVTAYDSLNTEQQSTVRSYKWTHAWDDKGYGSYVLMAQLTGEAKYKADAERWLDYWTTGYQGAKVKYTPGGLAQLDTWGATRYASNTSFIALIYSDYLKSVNPSDSRVSTYYNFAVSQLEYILGDNPMGISYQIGTSANGPKNPHHRGAHGTWADSLTVPTESRHLLVGALVGGPGTGDSYVDDRGDYIANEVATDYNAGFTGAVARLYMDFGGSPIAENQFPAPEVRDLEYFVEAKTNATGPRHVEISAKVYNRSAWPAANTDKLKFRYFVDLTAEKAKGYSVADVKVTAAYSQATSVSQLKPWGNAADDIYYTEIDFTGVDIFPGGQSDHKKEVQFRLSLPTTGDSADWVNAGDPSWDSYTNADKQAPKIAMYNDTALIWGSEPTPPCGAGTGINCAPSAQNVAVTTQQNTAVQVTLSAADSDGTIASYQVASPANGSLAGTGAVRTYTPAAGFFGVDSFTYTATDNSGAVSNEATVSVTVTEPIVPSVAISSPNNNAQVYTGALVPVSFTLANAASVKVLVNGGQVATGVTGSTVSITAPTSTGSFLVELIAQDASGADLSASASLTLNAVTPPANTPPVASFTSVSSGLTVNVDGSASSDADGDALTYSWDFAGVSKSGKTASHTFAAAGSYAVQLTVSDGIDTNVTSKSVSVTAPTPGVSCDYIVADQWNTGFVANIRLTNTTSAPVSNWSVTWSYPAGVARTNGWNATVVGNNPYTATSAGWNNTIQPGQYVEFGIQGTKPNGQAAPVPTVTGAVCQ